VHLVRGTAANPVTTDDEEGRTTMSTTPSTPPPAEGATPATVSAAAPTATGTSTGLDPKLSGLLSYLFGWVTGLIFFLIEKEHREVRFHAAQSILVSVTLIAGYLALGIVMMIPVIGLLALVGYAVLGLGGFALWVYLLVQGYHLKHVRLPVLGEIAERMAAS
jgi:uncharacterized membrane protein